MIDALPFPVSIFLGTVDCGSDNKLLASKTIHKTTTLTSAIPCLVGLDKLVMKVESLGCLVPPKQHNILNIAAVSVFKRDFHHAPNP